MSVFFPTCVPELFLLPGQLGISWSCSGFFQGLYSRFEGGLGTSGLHLYLFWHPKAHLVIWMEINILLWVIMKTGELEKDVFVLYTWLLVIKWLYNFDCWELCYCIRSHEMWGCVHFDHPISFQYYFFWKSIWCVCACVCNIMVSVRSNCFILFFFAIANCFW